MTKSNETEIEIACKDGIDFLKQVEGGSVDLILTDPPYSISKDTGMNKHYDLVKENKKKGVKYVKTEADWIQYKKKLDKPKGELDAETGWNHIGEEILQQNGLRKMGQRVYKKGGP